MDDARRGGGFFTRPPFWIGLIGLLVAVPVGLKLAEGPPLPVYQQLPDFTLVDQDGNAFGRKQLEGDVWVANFIFTVCPTVCPLLTARMATLERGSRDLGDKLRFVSFSVDPETDTPEVLKAFGAQYEQNTARWSMLTGPVDEIGRTVVESFKIAIDRRPVEGEDDDEPDLFEIVHGEHFVLVDRAGRIRGYYANDEASHERLMRDARRLAKAWGDGT